jgi:hypothetical protein
MSDALVSLMFTVGACTWIYTKLQRSSGNNTKQTLIAVGAIAVVMFGITFYIFGKLMS